MKTESFSGSQLKVGVQKLELVMVSAISESIQISRINSTP